MKSKILSLLSLSVLALVMFASLTSAAVVSDWALTSNGTASNVNSNVNAGTFTYSGVALVEFGVNGISTDGWPTTSLDTAKYLEVTIAPQTGSTLTISDISFDYNASAAGPASFQLQYSTSASFASPTTLTTKTDVSTGTAKTSSNSSLSIQVSSGETLTLRWFGYDFDADTNDFFVKTLSMQGTTTSGDPDEITDCSATGDEGGDLEIRIKDINVVSGFGDDDNFWYPLDEIEVEIEVENNGDEDIDDIAIEWGLYDVDDDNFIIDDEESDFNLKDGKDNTIYVNFKVEDVDDFTNNDYVFYVWANAQVDDTDNTDVCASDSQDIDITNDDNFVVLEDIEFPSTATCGSEIQITADVWNVGDNDEDEVTIVIFNSELGINKIIEIGDINDFDSENLDTFVEIPSDAEAKTYAISLKVFDDDHDIYETEEDNDESEYFIRVTVDGCSASSAALVSANLESGGKAGEELVVKSTITNSGTSSATYTINAASYSEWADSVSIDQSTFTLNAGSSKEVSFTFNVDESASGEKQFNIEVISGNDLVATQPVKIEIQETSPGFSGITGNVFSDSNKYLWGIGILNVFLIVFIIIVAIRVARK